MKRLIIAGLLAAAVVVAPVAAGATPLRGGTPGIGLSTRSGYGCNYSNTGESYSSTGATSAQGNYC